MSNVAGLEGSPFRDSRYPLVLAGSIFPQSTTKGSVKEFQPLSVGQAGVTKQLERVAQQQGDADRKLVEPGDLVINSRSDRRGASGLSSLTGLVSVVYTVLKPRTEYIDSRYAELLFKSKAFQDEYYRWGTGIVDDLWSTRYDRFASIRLPLPPLETQRRIADYLDKETAQIDTLVAELDEYVELLEKRKRSVVTYAVTRGVPGGEVKVAFPMVPLKHAIEKRFTGVWGSDEGADEVDVPCVRIADFNRETKTAGEAIPTVRSLPEKVLSDKCLRTFDILLEKSGGGEKTPVGDAMLYIGAGEVVCANFIEVIRPKSDSDSRYLVYSLGSNYSSGSTRPFVRQTIGIQNLDLQRYFDQAIPLPDLDTQRRIADYLDEETAKTDTIITQCRELKELLLKRRQVLITDVVTGKVEV